MSRYTKTTWVNYPVKTTPINAQNLNNIENGIEDNDTEIALINTNIGSLSNLDTTEKSSIVGAINEVKGDIPINVSDLTNDSNFIDASVNNLTNYYKKTETYTQTEVDTALSNLRNGLMVVVQELPQTGNTGVIYLVPKQDTSSGDNFDEYAYINNSWELLGSATIDLSNYVQKEAGKGLSTNDYTNADKTKLAGIEAGAEVNTIESIKVNGTEVTPDANRAVNITVSGGSSAIDSISVNGTPQTIDQNKNVDITVPTKTSDLTNDAGYQTANDVSSAIQSNLNAESSINDSGSTITLNDTLNAQIDDVILKGDTYQASDPTPDSPVDVDVVTGNNEVKVIGKNLLQLKTSYTETKNGVTIATSADGTITLNGTASAQTDFNDLNNVLTTIANELYTLNYIYVSGSETGSWHIFNQDPNNGWAGFNLNLNDAISITNRNDKHPYNLNLNMTTRVIRCDNGTSFNNLKFKLQFIKGDYDYDYTPYQEQTYLIGLRENLFSLTNTYTNNGVTYTFNNATLTANGTTTGGGWAITPMTSAKVATLDAGKYTLSFYYVSGTMSGTKSVVIRNLDTSTNLVDATYGAGTKYQFTLTTQTNIAFNLYELDSDRVYNDYTVNIYIEKENSPIELCKIGTYQDYIYKSNGKWYLHKEIGKVVLDGSENWIDSFSGQGGAALSGLIAYSPSSALSNLLIHQTGTSTWTDYGKFGFNTSGVLWCKVGDVFSTLSEWETSLSSNNLIIYYQLDTSTNTEITNTTLISQLEALYKAQTYLNQTNITSSSSNLPVILDITAFKNNINGKIGSNTNLIENVYDYIDSLDASEVSY